MGNTQLASGHEHIKRLLTILNNREIKAFTIFNANEILKKYVKLVVI